MIQVPIVTRLRTRDFEGPAHRGHAHLQYFDRLRHLFGLAAHTELDMTPGSVLAHVREAEDFQPSETLLYLEHERDEDAFRGVVDDDRRVGLRRVMMQMPVAVVEDLLDHRPGHHREAGNEMV